MRIVHSFAGGLQCLLRVICNLINFQTTTQMTANLILAARNQTLEQLPLTMMRYFSISKPLVEVARGATSCQKYRQQEHPTHLVTMPGHYRYRVAVSLFPCALPVHGS